MVAVNNKYKFGYKFDKYLQEPKIRVTEQVDRPKTHHGRLDAGWDDYEQDIIEELGSIHGVRLPRSG